MGNDKPLTTQEAVLSSRIEGTEATVGEVLEHEAGQGYAPNKEEDIQEIINYRKTLFAASSQISIRPIRLSLVEAMHKLLMDSVRGKDKEPGHFRKTQNWIGPKGCSMTEARFIPPSPLQLMDHLQEWERYLSEEDFDPLAQTAVMHAQFEILHPFQDGNGRIGRLLIPLFLCQKKRLSGPIFYMSAYLETNRKEYQHRLEQITSMGDWTGWIAFFLRGITDQANVNIQKVQAILALYNEMKQVVREATRSQYSAQIVDTLFERPIFQISDFAKQTNIPKPTAHELCRHLIEIGVLKNIRASAGRRPAIIGFPRLLTIIDA